MRAAELAETALNMKNVSVDAEDFWTTFEVIENGELGRQDTRCSVESTQLVRVSFLRCIDLFYVRENTYLQRRR